MRVVLIPVGGSEWCGDGRLLGRTEVPLTEQGRARALAWADELADAGIQRIFHAPDELATATARALAMTLDLTARGDEELAEVDVGLWAGLTEADLKSRFGKAHRQLIEAPLNVSPPGGEDVAEAVERLRGALTKRTKQNGKAPKPVGLVLRPLALGLARGILGEIPLNELWKARQACSPIVIDPIRDVVPVAAVD